MAQNEVHNNSNNHPRQPSFTAPPTSHMISSVAFIDGQQEKLMLADLDRMIEWLQRKDQSELTKHQQLQLRNDTDLPIATLAPRSRRNAVDYGREGQNETGAGTTGKTIAQQILRGINTAERRVVSAFKFMTLRSSGGSSSSNKGTLALTNDNIKPLSTSNVFDERPRINSPIKSKSRRPSNLLDNITTNGGLQQQQQSRRRKLSDIPSTSEIREVKHSLPATNTTAVPGELDRSAGRRGFIAIQARFDDGRSVDIHWFRHELVGLFRAGRGNGAYHVRQLKKKIRERLAIKGFPPLTATEMNRMVISYKRPSAAACHVSSRGGDGGKCTVERRWSHQTIETDGDFCAALQSSGSSGGGGDPLEISLLIL